MHTGKKKRAAPSQYCFGKLNKGKKKVLQGLGITIRRDGPTGGSESQKQQHKGEGRKEKRAVVSNEFYQKENLG